VRCRSETSEASEAPFPPAKRRGPEGVLTGEGDPDVELEGRVRVDETDEGRHSKLAEELDHLPVGLLFLIDPVEEAEAEGSGRGCLVGGVVEEGFFVAPDVEGEGEGHADADHAEHAPGNELVRVVLGGAAERGVVGTDVLGAVRHDRVGAEGVALGQDLHAVDGDGRVPAVVGRT